MKILNMKNYLSPIKIFFIHLIILVFSPVLTNAQTYILKNAPIGGGGFVTGIITHPSGDRYCRTDVGGAYRWDAANNKWIQLLDWINESENGFYGVEALAIDPQNANNVYMLCGIEYANNGRTAILKSTDKGNTFTYTDVTSKFKAHGNGYGRGNGERLAVDPQNSNILFCGSRANGLWKSTDAGVTWNQAWNGVTTTANNNGICFVLFDPSGSVVNGASQTVYIGVSRTGGGNIYKSTDGGSTFTDISATTDFMPHRAALQGTTMYVTYSDNEGPGTSEGFGKLYKLNTTTAAWTNVTPSHWQDYPYGGVSIDPTNVDRVVITTCGMYWNNQYGAGWGDFVFLSTDGGSTWTLKNGPNATFNNNGMAWSNGVVNWMDCIEFDPANPSIVRAIGGGGVYTCSDIAATNPSWKYDVIGIEETGMTDGISIPGGPFISTFGDITGFVHNDLTSSPASTHQPADGSNWSIAYATANTNKIVRVGSNNIYYSNDKGVTWTATATNKGDVALSKVAISADGGTTLNIPHGSTTTYYTTNDGGSWSSCSGVSTKYIIPVADPVNSNYFYIYDPNNGQMLSSSNKGVSFSVAGTPGTNTYWPWEKTTLIRTVPGLEGHLWVPLGGNGLKYSTDHGATYTTLANVPYCAGVGIGKTMDGASYPTLFIWGTVSGVTGLFRSTDKGATWFRMNDDAHEFGGTSMLIGDMNVDGRVYMSVNGTRGLIYWDDPDAVQDPDSVTGILDEHPQAFQMYPNPTDASITISDAANLRSVTIRDVRGRTLSSSYNGTKVSLEGLPAGIYVIEVVDQQSKTIIKRVIKR
jgi:xyloglucan-specific exo-beta-1,4-glucanase